MTVPVRKTPPTAPPAPVDVLVVGGGVHGAAIARDAALRGLSVALVEARDFGWATSSRSSKLLHGGLRYLERFHVRLVRESLAERDIILRIAPHLTWPLPFLVPLTGPAPRPPWMLRAGLTLYDALAGGSALPRHRVVEQAEAERLAPGLSGSGVRRAALYHDAGVDDLRLVVDMVLDAADLGATCLPHARVEGLLREGARVVGARVAMPGAIHEVRARTTVLACGAWTDRVAPRSSGTPRLLVTQGSHVLTRRPLVRDAALFLATPGDRRIFFVIPWLGGALVGTTDTVFSGPAEDCRPTAEDVRYLLDALAACLPGMPVGPEDVVAAQSGLRPLVAPRRGGPSAPSSLSRDYHLDASEPGLVVVEGGKYTIFRKLAERVVDACAEAVRAAEPSRSVRACETKVRPLGSALPEPERESLVGRLVAAGAPRPSAELVASSHGRRAEGVLAAAAGDPRLLRPPCASHPHVPAQAIHALRSELAATPADALLRRLQVGWWPCDGSCRNAWLDAFVRAGLGEAEARVGLDESEREMAFGFRVRGG